MTTTSQSDHVMNAPERLDAEVGLDSAVTVYHVTESGAEVGSELGHTGRVQILLDSLPLIFCLSTADCALCSRLITLADG